MTLHLPTILVVTVLAYLLFGLFQFAMWQLRRTEEGLLLWGMSNLAGATGGSLLALRGVAPDFLTIVLANGSLVLASSLMWAGLRRFAGQPVHWLLVWLAPLVVMTLFWGFPPISESPPARICVTSLMLMLFAAANFVDAWRAQNIEALSMRRLAMLMFLATVVFMGDRVIYMLHRATRIDEYAITHPMHTYAALGALLIVTVWNLAVLMMANERLANRLTAIAHSDGLTRSLNRTGFRALAGRQVQRCRRDHEPVSLLLLDLDHFKKVNDNYGHEAGDRLLCAFAATAGETIRVGDLLARYGGEEFCVLLPDSNLAEAAKVAERLRARFDLVRIRVGDVVCGATVSIGVAEFNAGETIDQCVARADRALYAAKRNGRNRVETTESVSPGRPSDALA